MILQETSLRKSMKKPTAGEINTIQKSPSPEKNYIHPKSE